MVNQKVTAKLQRRLISFLSGLFIAALPVSLSAGTYIGVLQGLGGEDYYQRQFDEQVDAIKTSSEQVPGTIDLQLFVGKDATKANVLSWLETLASKSTSEDRFAFYYVGHGSYDEKVYKFNLSGPDLSSDELKGALENISAELKLIVNTSSSSGALLETFEPENTESAPSENTANILLLTATKNGRERNATRFGRFFSEALTEESADLDKNQLISAKEAFAFAERQTQDFYSSEGLIATEHPVLRGEHANLFTLASLTNRPTSEVNPELAALYEQRDDIDLEIERLRMRRIGMSEQNYRKDFQSLMIKLSLLQVEIDEKEGVDQ